MKAIDFHTHVFQVNCNEPEKSLECAVRRYLEGVEETPVEKMVVFPSNGSLPGFSFDVLYPKMKKLPKVFFAATLRVSGNPRLQEDIERVKELLKETKVVGVKLYPGYDHFFPADERLDPLYSYLSKRRTPVVFHSGETYEEVREASPRYSHPLNFFDLAEKYPKLRFVVAHVGYPWFHDVGELLLQFDHAYTDISDILPERDYRYRDVNMEFVRRGVLEAISMVGDPTKFLFATDWMMGSGDYRDYSERFWYYYSFLQTLPATEEELEAMSWKIAERLFFGWKD